MSKADGHGSVSPSALPIHGVVFSKEADRRAKPRVNLGGRVPDGAIQCVVEDQYAGLLPRRLYRRREDDFPVDDAAKDKADGDAAGAHGWVEHPRGARAGAASHGGRRGQDAEREGRSHVGGHRGCARVMLRLLPSPEQLLLVTAMLSIRAQPEVPIFKSTIA